MQNIQLDTPKIQQILKKFGIQTENYAFSTQKNQGFSPNSPLQAVHTPINGDFLASVRYTSQAEYTQVIQTAKNAFADWRKVPSPKRGDIVRQFGDKLRAYKADLGYLVSLEMGKIYQEGLGEVQEMIDICEFAVGLSRQLYGNTIHSERPLHRMFEQYHPLGVVGIISAFNFPVAVWAWNASLAWICGNTCVWKPSEKTPLTALACQFIFNEVAQENNLQEGISCLILGDRQVGEWLANDENVPLISATGSTRMGREVGKMVAGRFGKSILELGGNNAVIITENADVEMAIRSTIFGAVGTCGQRCTTTRRLIVHEKHYDYVKTRLVNAYKKLTIGSPLTEGNLVSPLIDKDAVKNFENALKNVQAEGGKLIVGGELLGGNYVSPAIIEAENHYEMVQHETFAPILYLLKYQGSVENAIHIQNDVKQGLSSAIFSLNMRETELFLSAQGSDCGIANANIGTSGAEIGGAFGGEKETGGGRESGSDAWRAYMRRQTNTINYSDQLPLAQGIKFDVE